ncbi:hypothetical protein E4T43_09091 [Aureobasidium subglaciale]|nr:hypothetical protein E4T43_09091 [Aureobasidium subglaciale]
MSPQQPLSETRQQESHGRIGLLSRTLVPTPAIRWILPARIRSPIKDDYLCIGRDFIQLWEVESEVNINLIATKHDFDGDIGGANIIGYFDSYESEFRKDSEEANNRSDDSEAPMGPQMLTFTLVNSKLLYFLTASENKNGEVIFKLSCIPIPKFTSPPRMIGNPVAVDPRSRALAVAAGERDVFICYTNPASLLSSGTQRWDNGFFPVSEVRVAHVEGTILLMDFLYPPGHDQDRVVLLMIVLYRGIVRPTWAEWSYSDEHKTADMRLGQRIYSDSELPHMLIPLKGDAAFILATKKGITTFEHILTTAILSTRQGIDKTDPPRDYPPSTNKPAWAHWVRPRRNVEYEEEDYIYLISEDGNVYYVIFVQESPAEGVVINHVGSLKCHVDSACAPFGRSAQGDILIAHGASSEGCVWISDCRQAPTSHLEPNGGMHGYIVSQSPNWSGNFDLIAKSTSRGKLLPNSRDTLFAPSGRQPYGKITELRMGIEARIDHEVKNFQFGVVSHAWMLPVEQEDVYLVMLSGPEQTHILSIPQSPDDNFILAEQMEPAGLDLQHSTLAAAIVYGCILQITEFAICSCCDSEDSSRIEQWPPGYKAVAAAIDENLCLAAVVLRKDTRSEIRFFNVEEAEHETVSTSEIGKPTEIEDEVVSVAIHSTTFLTFIVAGTSGGALHIFRVSPRHRLELYLEHEISHNVGNLEVLSACEDILILGKQTLAGQPVGLVVLCGLRGGSIYALELQANLDATLQINSQQHYSLGLTSVRLKPGKTYSSAIATCGDGLFSISLKGTRTDSLSISDIYLTDKERGFQQEAVAALSLVPYAETSTISEALLVFSNDTCYVTSRFRRRGVVPRNIKARGSPHTLIECKQSNCFVSAASYGWLRSPTTRAVRDVVQFSSGDWSCTYEMDIGFKVYAMAEWSVKRHVVIVLAAGRLSQPQHDIAPRSDNGRLYLLQSPTVGESDHVAVLLKPSLFDSPVTAVATYGETGIVACSGTKVYFLEYDTQAPKFRLKEICNFVMHSPGVRVTTSPPHIHVTTELDSTLTLQLVASPTEPYSRRLHNVARGDGARMSSSHTTINVTDGDDVTSSFNLTSTMNCELVGLQIPDPNRPPAIATHDTLFTAKLTRSVMRVVEANVRPPWKPAKAKGVLKDDLVGIATDGTIYGFAILDERTTNRLRWVQKLCQRNAEICPFTFGKPQTFTQNGSTKQIPVMLPPPGFDTASDIDMFANENTARRSRRYRPSDMHVDGDFLVRLLAQDGVELLTLILDIEAAKETHDAISTWVRDNLESQKREVEALIREAAAVIDRWW